MIHYYNVTDPSSGTLQYGNNIELLDSSTPREIHLTYDLYQTKNNNLCQFNSLENKGERKEYKPSQHHSSPSLQA